MIYIDPPYNRGNDFIYKDNFVQDINTYKENSGQYDNEGNRLMQNTDTNGRFHTDWLNMMYPRLKLARDLLTDDGIIFISIDDKEQANLKKICDEIFDENNYINQFTWISNITGRQIAGKGAAKTWESILLYCKNKNTISSLIVDIDFAKKYMIDAYKGFDIDIKEDTLGLFIVGDTLYNHNRIFNEETRPNLVFSIFYNPKTKDIIPDDIASNYPGYIELLPHKNNDGIHRYHAWRWSKEKIIKESQDLIVLKQKKGYEIYTKRRNFSTTLLKDIITNIPNGDSELLRLFNGKKFFNYPKSTTLIYTLLASFNTKNNIILDFFSGSATTADAVMQLNAEDGGKRKFIMVQLPEKTAEKSAAYKAGYKNICEIGKERIRRAGKKIKEDFGDKAADLDIGFRVLKTDSSNMKDVFYTPAEYVQGDLDDYINNIKDDRTNEDLLFQVMLDMGITLDSSIKVDIIAGKKVFNVADNFLLACFDIDVTDEVVTAMAKQKPDYAVLRDLSMVNDAVAVNFEQIFKTYSPDTVAKVL